MRGNQDFVGSRAREDKRAIGITVISRDDLIPGQMEVAYDKKTKSVENSCVVGIYGGWLL